MKINISNNNNNNSAKRKKYNFKNEHESLKCDHSKACFRNENVLNYFCLKKLNSSNLNFICNSHLYRPIFLHVFVISPKYCDNAWRRKKAVSYYLKKEEKTQPPKITLFFTWGRCESAKRVVRGKKIKLSSAVASFLLLLENIAVKLKEKVLNSIIDIKIRLFHNFARNNSTFAQHCNIFHNLTASFKT